MKIVILFFGFSVAFAYHIVPSADCHKVVISDGECPLLVHHEGVIHHCTQTLNSDGYSKTCHIGSPVRSKLLKRQGLFKPQ